jgi:hypothetical protein
MINKGNVRDQGRAVVLFPNPRAAALFLLVLPAAIPTQVFGQSSRILGSQMHIATNSQTGSSYSVTASDCGKLLSLSSSGSIAVGLPQAGATGLESGCWIDVQNTGSGSATFTATSTLIDGGTAFSLASNQGLRLVSDGTAYFTQRGQGSGGSSLTVQSGGTALGSASILNVVGGTGVSCVPQVNAGVATFQCNADTSYLVSKVTLQSAANPQVCTSASGNGAVYTATCGSALTAYATKQTLFWYADVANSSTAPTLNIDSLGAIPLIRHDGTSLAISDIKAGTLCRIWHDGTNFRVVEAGIAAGAGGGGSVASSLPAGIGLLAVSGGTLSSPRTLTAGSGKLTVSNGDGAAGNPTVDIGVMSCAGLSNASASCATDATNATNITTGTLAAARGGAGTNNGILRADGSGLTNTATALDVVGLFSSCSGMQFLGADGACHSGTGLSAAFFVDLGPMAAADGFTFGSTAANGWGLAQDTENGSNVPMAAIPGGSYYMAIWQFSQTNNNAIAKLFYLPADYDPASTPTITFAALPDTASGTGNFGFKAKISCTVGVMSNGWTYNAPATTGPVAVNAAAYQQQSVTTGTLTMTGCSAGSLAKLVVLRDISAAGNTAVTVDLATARFNYTRR